MNALDAAGIQASRIASLFWVFLVVCGVTYALVQVALVVALARRKDERPRPAETDSRTEHVLTRRVGLASIVTVLVLVGLLVASVRTGKALASLRAEERLLVKVTAHQWWWEVQYLDPQPSRFVTTANELHLPAGRPVEVILQSTDVIHSFWIPNLHGKRDLIPGYTSTTVLQADRPGVYRGECAEFCGYQHAHMAFDVVVEPRDAFDAWLDHQREPAVVPHDEQSRRGQTLFSTRACTMCHTIRGTDAAATVAPDLTHVASRRSLAAGLLPNGTGPLAAAWIANSDHLKPGTKMPGNVLSGEELNALVAYVGGLR